MSRLAANSTGRLEIVLMLFFGQSITQQNWWREVAADFWASFTAAGLRLISFPSTPRAKRCTRQPPPAIFPLPRSSCRRLPSKNFSRAFATENLSSTSLGCGLARRDECRLPVAPASITGFDGAGRPKKSSSRAVAALYLSRMRWSSLPRLRMAVGPVWAGSALINTI